MVRADVQLGIGMGIPPGASICTHIHTCTGYRPMGMGMDMGTDWPASSSLGVRSLGRERARARARWVVMTMA